MLTDVFGSFGSRTIPGSSMRAAKKLFVMCAAYYVSYAPVMFRQLFIASRVPVCCNVDVGLRIIGSEKGFLYMAIHSSVRRELRHYIPRCRRPTVTTASLTQLVGDAGARQQDKELLKKIQHRYTKMIMNMQDKAYEERLRCLRLWILELRRNRQNVIEVFKMYRGLNNDLLHELFTLDENSKGTADTRANL